MLFTLEYSPPHKKTTTNSNNINKKQQQQAEKKNENEITKSLDNSVIKLTQIGARMLAVTYHERFIFEKKKYFSAFFTHSNIVYISISIISMFAHGFEH